MSGGTAKINGLIVDPPDCGIRLVAVLPARGPTGEIPCVTVDLANVPLPEHLDEFWTQVANRKTAP